VYKKLTKHENNNWTRCADSLGYDAL